MQIFFDDEYELEITTDKYGEPPLIAKVEILDFDAGYEYGRYYVPPSLTNYAVTGLTEDETERYKKQIEEGVQYIFEEHIQTLVEREK